MTLALIAAMLVSAAVLGLGACAVTPPGKLLPISDATAVAGKWQGTVRDIRGRLTDTFLTLTDTGKDTGTSESFVEGSVFTGTFRIKDGKGETRVGRWPTRHHDPLRTRREAAAVDLHDAGLVGRIHPGALSAR